MRTSKRVYFENAKGIRLCGILDQPTGETWSRALFSHCFTCTKDLKAIVRISRHLAERGIAVLRFDFTGLGDSQGRFSDTTFADNCDDVRAAAQFLNKQQMAPELLIGHSLGGAAMVAVAPEIASARAVVTIASPSTTEHLADYLSRTHPDILERGEGEVTIGGRRYRLRRELIENLRQTDLPSALERLQLPHLIFHPDRDQTLPYWHAERMFELTGGIKSMVTLHDSDHLLVDRPDDPAYVASLIVPWFRRYSDESRNSTER